MKGVLHPSVPQRVLARLLHRFGQLAYGPSWLVIHEEAFATLGVRRMLTWLSRATEIVGALTRCYGEADAQFLVALVAAWNGCGACGYGHALAGSLVVFRDRGVVHPLSAEQMARLQELPAEQAAAELDRLLAAPEHTSLRRAAARLLELRAERVRPQTREDHLLEAVLRVWGLYAECTIVVGATLRPEDATCQGHPVGRDPALLARYHAARRGA